MSSNPSSTNRQLPRYRLGRAAFSIVELLMMVAVISVLTGIAITIFYNDSGAVNRAKLESDVSTLNQMVSIYIADGGDLNGLTSPQAVLDKMKRVRPQADVRQHTGVASGRLIDVRLSARTTTQRGSGEEVRAKWNPTTRRFEITADANGAAVSEFFLDESLATRDYGTESRRTLATRYNGNRQGWVWATGTNANANPLRPTGIDGNGDNAGFNPTETAPTSGPGNGTGGGGGTGTGGDGGGGNPTPVALPTPAITPVGGVFPFASFPTTATIADNGAPAGKSRLMVNTGSGWTQVTSGATITLTPAMRILAKNETLDATTHYDSAINSQSYYRLTAGFSGSGTGSWGNVDESPNTIYTTENGDPTSTFKHGNTKLDLGNGQFLDAGIENVLTFTRSDFSTVTPNTWFRFGTLNMLNGTTFYDSEATGVTLSVNLNLTQPSQPLIAHIDLGLISTENSSDRLASADIVELQNPRTDAKVIIDGVEYTLELSWATLDPGAGVVQGNQFLVFEGSTARAELRARFKSNP